MCSGKTIPVKTLCRVLAFLNLFAGLLAIFYLELRLSFTHHLDSASKWESVFHLNSNIRETILQKCGQDYLTINSPRQFGSLYWLSITFYKTACGMFCVKGSALFFITCFNPILAKRCSIGILLVDACTTCLLLYALYLFRSPALCLLEHTDGLYYPAGQQTRMTVATLGFLLVFKPVELISILCFICDQNKLIASGETRSKGARRSDAFRTPMTSRANSFLYGNKGFIGGYYRMDKNNNAKAPIPEELAKALQQLNSDDDVEDQDEEGPEYAAGICEDTENHGSLNYKDFTEINLNDNENNNEFPHFTGSQSITVLHVHSSDANNTKRGNMDKYVR